MGVREQAALGFKKAHRFLPSLDPDALDDSQQGRATETATEVVAWAQACGLGSISVNAVTEVLLDHDAFAETGWRRLLALVGLDQARVTVVEDSRPAPAVDRGLRRNRPPRAIAIDHEDEGWHHLDEGELMGRFGEPPCLLDWRDTLYLATDPPLHLFSCDESMIGPMTGATGEWQSVPQSAASSLADAASWARAHVGIPGAPAPLDRPPLLFEVIDAVRDDRRPWHRRAQEWQLHEQAPPVSAVLFVAWEAAAPESAAEAITDVHDLVIGQVVEVFTSAGRGVHFGEQIEPESWDLQVVGSVSRTNGRIAVTTAKPAAWSKLRASLSQGEVERLSVGATRTNAFGNTWPSHTTASVQYELCLVSDHKKLGFDEDDEAMDKSWPTPRLTVSVNAEFAALLPVSSLMELLQRFAERLPVHHAWLDVGRFPGADVPWLLVQPVAEPWDEATFPVAEVQGGLRWLRTSGKPPEFEPRIN